MRRHDRQITFRAADPLRAELEAAAREAGEDLSETVRAILVDWCSRRVAERGSVAEMGPLPLRSAIEGDAR